MPWQAQGKDQPDWMCETRMKNRRVWLIRLKSGAWTMLFKRYDADAADRKNRVHVTCIKVSAEALGAIVQMFTKYMGGAA